MINKNLYILAGELQVAEPNCSRDNGRFSFPTGEVIRRRVDELQFSLNDSSPIRI